ncbi:hypothetical protein [Saccharothrix sp.]|uniref:hypothetical protein n=1 Tax=Saccharothrix sp. TaxID=1873460 RepID=UPI0028110C21|nr:hypothetical protein [Saccharothrix sp.]
MRIIRQRAGLLVALRKPCADPRGTATAPPAPDSVIRYAPLMAGSSSTSSGRLTPSVMSPAYVPPGR